MAEHKVLRVSQQEPQIYDGPNGRIYYIKVQLEGHNKPVSIGKKNPDSIKAGDVVNGTITSTLYESDKFTADKNFTARDDSAIRAQFAIKAAIAYLPTGDPAAIENAAIVFYAMVDRVKNSGSQGDKSSLRTLTTTNEGQSPTPAASTRNWDEVGKGSVDEVYPITETEPIDLTEIPF